MSVSKSYLLQNPDNGDALRNLLLQKPDERRDGLAEYVPILVLVVVIAILMVLWPTVSQVYCRVTNAWQAGGCGVVERVALIRSDSSQVEIRVEVSEDTTLIVTNSHNTDVQSVTCAAPTCAFSLGGLGNDAGTIRIVDGDGMTTAVSFPAY